MSESELRAVVSEARRMERRLKAPHAKARRGWKQLREQAESELEARAADIANHS